MISRLFSRRAFATGKKIITGQDARQLMLEGCQKLSQAVAVTLGPRGRNVIIDQSFGAPKITKDGVTVAKNINFKNRYHNMGAALIKSVATKANNEAGDGTTTASILANHIYKMGVKEMLHGGNATEIRKGILLAVEQVSKTLNSLSVKISRLEDIANVASISANNDLEIGQMIGEIMARLGKDGVVNVEEGKTLKTEVDYISGMRIDRGYVSPYFLTDVDQFKCQFDNPLILFIEKKLSSNQQLLPFLEYAAIDQKRPLVIISEEVESEPLTTLIINRLKSSLRVCVVKAPGFGDNRKNIMSDLAYATGGQLISEETDNTLERLIVNPEHIPLQFGEAKRVIISKDETIIMEGARDQEQMEKKLKNLEIERENLNSVYDQEKVTERIGRLSGRVAIIKVGASSEVELKELKDRIEDAIASTRAAIDEGIVPGGGIALLHAQNELHSLQGKNEFQERGVKIVKDSLTKPLITICENAGINGEVVLNAIQQKKEKNYGYDAQKGEFKDLLKAGIIDPTKVVRTAIVDAAGVASLMLTTESTVVEEPEKKSKGEDDDDDEEISEF